MNKSCEKKTPFKATQHLFFSFQLCVTCLRTYLAWPVFLHTILSQSEVSRGGSTLHCNCANWTARISTGFLKVVDRKLFIHLQWLFFFSFLLLSWLLLFYYFFQLAGDFGAETLLPKSKVSHFFLFIFLFFSFAAFSDVGVRRPPPLWLSTWYQACQCVCRAAVSRSSVSGRLTKHLVGTGWGAGEGFSNPVMQDVSHRGVIHSLRRLLSPFHWPVSPSHHPLTPPLPVSPPSLQTSLPRCSQLLKLEKN